MLIRQNVCVVKLDVLMDSVLLNYLGALVWFQLLIS